MLALATKMESKSRSSAHLRRYFRLLAKHIWLYKQALSRNHAKKDVAMQSIMPSLTLSLPRVPFLFSPASLFARFRTLTDQRDPRGIRYPLAILLTIATLAKLAEHLPRGRPPARHRRLGAVARSHADRSVRP